MIVKFYGGLGNQLFQFAFMKSLEKKYANYDVLAETSLVSKDNKDIELERVFNLKLNKAELHVGNLFSKRYHLIPSKIASRFNKQIYIDAPYIITEKNICKKKQGKNSCFWGFWQSEQWFWDVKDIIENEIRFPVINDEYNSRIKRLMNQSFSASLHIRRGDYVGNNYFVDLTKTDYYFNAIKRVQEINPDALFFVFSNDIPWCREYLKNVSCEFVNYNKGDNAWKDLALMSFCKVNIVANSSFSWWGGYLNQNSIKMKPDSIGTAFENDHPNYYPNSWKTIKTKGKNYEL